MADSTTRQEIDLLQGLISDTINASSDASLESGIDAEVSASLPQATETALRNRFFKLLKALNQQIWI